MKDILKDKSIYLIGLAFIVLLVVIVFVALKIGSAYRSGINKLSDQPSPGNVTHTTKEKIRKLTLKNGNNKGCIEITPDGIVKVYEICGEKLSDSNRLSDTKNIIRLFKIVDETEFSASSSTNEAVNNCINYVLTIQTDNGEKNICLENEQGGSSNGTTNGGGNNGIVGDIIKTIEDIINDIPPTPTVTDNPYQPTPTAEATTTIEPTESIQPGEFTTPTPTVVVQKPFTCDYVVDSTGKKRPFNVSNILCSSEPAPGQ
jgi:hypothetical protein